MPGLPNQRAMPQMKRCPDCQAPNPPERSHCFACGQYLSRRRPGEPVPGEQSFPCANCGAQVAFGANACPGCGRVLHPAATTSPLGQGALAALPRGWEIHTLPGGEVRILQRDRGEGTVYDVAVPAFCLIGFGLITRWVLAAGGRTYELLRGPLSLLGLAVLLFLLWRAMARTEVYVGVGWMTLRRHWLGIGWGRRLEGPSGRLRILTVPVRSDTVRRKTQRALIAEAQGSRLVLHTKTSDAELLAAVLKTSRDEVGVLGDLFAARTGWPLNDPAAAAGRA